MNNLVLVIIDDEPKVRELLKKYIEMIYPNNRFQFVLCNSVKTGIEAIENYLPDLVFLDIEMPEANGFELFNSVNKESFEVVFTTAYAQYMEKAINEIGCFGYLLKPFEQQKLRLIFERYSQKADQSKHLKFINGNQNKRTMVHLDDVIFCKAENNYCELHLKNSKYLLSKTLGSLEKRLPKNMFKRVHRSYIVNLNYINHFNKLKNELHLNHENELLENEIPVSAKYKEEIVNLFL